MIATTSINSVSRNVISNQMERLRSLIYNVACHLQLTKDGGCESMRGCGLCAMCGCDLCAMCSCGLCVGVACVLCVGVACVLCVAVACVWV